MKLINSPLPANGYFHDAYPKDMVMLHFTAGSSAMSAISTFRTTPQTLKYPVSTPYVVENDGSLYTLFSETLWSYHLGVQGAAAENHRHDKRSIAIEIVNVGPLRHPMVGNGTLCWWPNNFGTVWCRENETDRYVELDVPFRNETHFAAFSAFQVETVAALVEQLCNTYSIPKVLPPLDRQFRCDLAYYATYKGVASHVNFRPDKTDLAPTQSDPIWAALEKKGFVHA